MDETFKDKWQKTTAAQEKESALIRRLNLKCDELACEFFEKSDDLAAVSFALRQVIVTRLSGLEEEEFRKLLVVNHGG